MPGIVGIVSENRIDLKLVLESLSKLKYDKNAITKRLIETGNIFLGFSGYEDYPNQYIKTDDFIIFLEGLIYNKTDINIESSLKHISEEYLENRDYKKSIKKFMDNADGEYIVVIYFLKDNNLILFNDRWGRLPLFYYEAKKTFIFSREIKFILELIPLIEFDKICMADFLIFNYQLGKKTLFKGISRVSPSCLFNLKQITKDLNITFEELFIVNFEKSSKRLSEREYISKANDLFQTSIENRLNKVKEKGFHSIVDLSGGYDTRAVLAGICRFKVKPTVYTKELVTGDESEYAKKVADLYNIKIHGITASHSMNFLDMNRITYLTDCMVNAWTALSCYNDSAELRRQVKETSVEFMGFGGEFLRHPEKAKKYHKTMIDVILDKYSVEIKNACSILNLDQTAFYDYITVYFNEYHELNIENKVKHFYFEYYNHLVGAGEDRHRLHFWTVQPLQSKDLFSFAIMDIPSKIINFEFFRKFLFSMDPLCCKAPIYGSPLQLDSKKSVFLFNMKEKYLNIIRNNNFVYDLIKVIHHEINKSDKYIINIEQKGMINIISELYNTSELIPMYFNKEDVHIILKEGCNPNYLYHLLSLFLYFSEIELRYKSKLTTKK